MCALVKTFTIPIPKDLVSYEECGKSIAYLLDVGYSILAFTKTLASLENDRPLTVCFESGLAEKLANLCDHVIVPLKSSIQSSLDLTKSQRQQLLTHLSLTTACLVEAVRSAFIESHLLAKLISSSPQQSITFVHSSSSTSHQASSSSSSQQQPSSSGSNSLTLVDQLAALLFKLTSYKHFTQAMQLLHPLEDDVVVIEQVAGPDLLKTTNWRYMTEAVAGIMADLPSAAETNDQRNVASASSEPNGGADSLVIKVKEVLPDLSDDLIRRCLIEYNNDSERVINAALEGSIPDHLLNPPPSAETSSNKPRQQQEQIKPSDNNLDPNRDLASAAASGLLQLQPGQVWQGKKNHALSNAPMSRREKKQTKKMAISVWDDDVDEKGSSDEEEGAGSVDRNRVVGKQIPRYSTVDNRDYLYDDEYDDSYDLHVGAVVSENESDSCQPDEPKQRSSAVAPSTLPSKKSVKFKQGPDEVREIAARGAGDEESKPPVRQNVLPIPHPEEVRVQQAHKQLNKAYRRGRVKAGGGSNLPPPQPLPTDTSSTSLPQTRQSGRNDQSAVVDTPASNISSDQSSTRSRAYKEKHKASQANHRRKDRGARKRSVLF